MYTYLLLLIHSQNHLCLFQHPSFFDNSFHHINWYKQFQTKSTIFIVWQLQCIVEWWCLCEVVSIVMLLHTHSPEMPSLFVWIKNNPFCHIKLSIYCCLSYQNAHSLLSFISECPFFVVCSFSVTNSVEIFLIYNFYIYHHLLFHFKCPKL